MSQALTTSLRHRLEEVAALLSEEGIEAPRAEAEGLMGAAVGASSRHALYLEDRELSRREQALLEGMIVRRLAGEPLQYITGEAAFRMLTIHVDRRAFIPRPETEGLVEVALQLMGSQERATVLDAGTGSGAIALSLAMERPSWAVLAADASAAALDLARENAERYDLARIDWMEADVTNFTFWRLLPPLDLVISNPPYVAENEWDDLPAEVREYEPPRSLLAGADGLDVIRPLLEGASFRTKPGGLIVMEIGETQGEVVSEIARRCGFVDVRVAPDLSARPRYLIAEQRRRVE